MCPLDSHCYSAYYGEQAVRAGGCHNMPPPPASWPFHLESGVRVTCDVGYLWTNFSLPIGLSVLDFGPMYATNRHQTSDIRQTRIIAYNAPATSMRAGHNKVPAKTCAIVLRVRVQTMFEEETERYETGSSFNVHAQPPTIADLQLRDAGSLPLVFAEEPPPSSSSLSPGLHRRAVTASRIHPRSVARRSRSGSVPCHRERLRDQPRQVRRVLGPPTQAPTALSVPRIVVVDQSQQPATEHREVTGPDALRSTYVDDSPADFRPRCRTVSLDPTDQSLFLVLLRSRTLSLSTDLWTSSVLSSLGNCFNERTL